MTPTFDNVYLHEIKKDLKTESGLILQSDVETGNKPAKVVAVGPEVKYVKEGDTVYANWQTAVAVTHDGVQGVLIKEENILGVA